MGIVVTFKFHTHERSGVRRILRKHKKWKFPVFPHDGYMLYVSLFHSEKAANNFIEDILGFYPECGAKIVKNHPGEPVKAVFVDESDTSTMEDIKP